MTLMNIAQSQESAIHFISKNLHWNLKMKRNRAYYIKVRKMFMKQEKRKFQIQKEEGASNPAKMSHSTSSSYLLVYSSMYLFVWDFHFLLECFTQNSKLPSTAAMQKQLPLYLWQLGSSLVEELLVVFW